MNFNPDDLIKAVDKLSKEGLALLDSDGNYVYLNPRHARIYGYEVEELLGKPWQTLYSEEQRDFIGSQVMGSFAEFGEFTRELIGKKKDGGSVIVHVSLTALDDGKLFCVCRDITEEEKMKQRERDRLIQQIMELKNT